MNQLRTAWYVGLALTLSLAACSDDVIGPNRPPVALAGPDQVVRPGVRVTLDGSGSFDPDGDALAGFAWSLLTAPAGSQASLDPAQARQPRVDLTPDLPGAYLLSLVVDDGQLASARDVLQVRAVAAPCVTSADCPDDGLWCTGTPECVDGGCVETPPDCSDGDPCTQDLCDEELDRCAHPPIEDPPPEGLGTAGSCADGVDNDCDGATDGDDPGCVGCLTADDCPDDGLWCTGTADCVGGACVETPPDCSDGDACTQDLCDEDFDRCAHPVVADPPPEDLATAGSCTDGVDNDCDGLTDGEDLGCLACQDAGDCPDDGDACTGVECVAGACQYPAANEGGPCDDEFFCTDTDVCAGGACQGQPRDCSAAADACHTGVCDELGAACVPVPVPDGTACGQGACAGLQWSRSICEQGACTGTESQDCDDQNPCTLDSCDPASACGNLPAHEGEECGARACDLLQWTRVVCRAGACDLVEPVEDCFDGNPCTDDGCDAAAGCQNVPNEDPCDDGDACTAGDACLGGTCHGALLDVDGDGYGPLALGCGLDCDDGDEFVNPGVFEGSFGEAVCLDGVDNDCDGLTDEEDSTCLQCLGDGDCDNGIFCDGVETCVAGACLPGANPCLPETECNHCNEDAENCFDPLATACGSPADTACDNPDSCDGAGACLANHEGAGFACGDPSDTECTDPDSCDGAGVCLAWHAPEFTACPDALFCNGAESCDASGVCVDRADPCPETDCNHCDEVADSCLDPAGTACGDPGKTECTDPDTCDGGGLCLENHLADGTACRGAMTEESCDSSCVAGSCDDAVPVADLTACTDPVGSAGICCAEVCRPGGECCAAADCDDGNGCTADDCSAAYACVGDCPDPTCMLLDVESPATVGVPTPVNIDMCPAARDVDDFVCISSRNHTHLFLHQDFETDLSGFTINTNLTVTRQQDVGGNWYARICNNGSYMRARLDASGLKDILVRVTLADINLPDNQLLEFRYSLDAANWTSLGLIGDNVASMEGPTTFQIVLPMDANDAPTVDVEFYLRSGPGGACASVDDVTILAMLPRTTVATLLSADFEAGVDPFGPFNEFDPQNNDVYTLTDGGSVRVRIDDNEGANLFSDPIDTTAVSPYDLLVLSWDWIETSGLNGDDYIVVEYSTDNVTWYQLAATGHEDGSDAYRRPQVVLPCEAHGHAGLRVRFIGPRSADNDDGEGVNIDNVLLEVMRPAYLDVFGPFTDLSGGFYAGNMSSAPDGSFEVTCRYGCSQWSNADPVTVNP